MTYPRTTKLIRQSDILSLLARIADLPVVLRARRVVKVPLARGHNEQVLTDRNAGYAV